MQQNKCSTNHLSEFGLETSQRKNDQTLKRTCIYLVVRVSVSYSYFNQGFQQLPIGSPLTHQRVFCECGTGSANNNTAMAWSDLAGGEQVGFLDLLDLGPWTQRGQRPRVLLDARPRPEHYPPTWARPSTAQHSPSMEILPQWVRETRESVCVSHAR
jgi:hypothetical protein